MSRETKHEIPDEVDFNNDQIKAIGARRSLAPTGEKRRIRFVVTGTAKTVFDTGSMAILLTCSPLKDPKVADSRTSLTVRHSLILPLPNPNVEGHEAPNTGGMCHAYYYAVLGAEKMPDYPRKIDGELVYKGERIEKDAEEACKAEVNALVAAQLKADWKNGGADRMDDAFYAEVFNNNKGFTNLRHLSEDMPKGCSYVPASEFVAAGTSDGAEKKSAGANGKEKAANGAKGNASGSAGRRARR